MEGLQIRRDEIISSIPFQEEMQTVKKPSLDDLFVQLNAQR